MPLFVSSGLVSSVIRIATIYLAGVSSTCSLFLLDLFGFSLCFLRSPLASPLHRASSCVNGICGYHGLPCFLFWFLQAQKRKIKQGKGETLSVPDLQKGTSGKFFRFQEYYQIERILFFQSNKLSAYYRIHFIRRSQNTFQTKLTSLPYFHETLIIGGIYLQ